jgi:hypothetical protein
MKANPCEPDRPRSDDPWQAAMRAGDFGRAWEISAEIRRRRNGRKHEGPRHLQAIWDGTPLNGKRVLVRCYHGLGDTIQFIRYAPLVRAVAAEVIWWVQPQLMPLLADVRGVDRLLALHDGTPEADFDVDVELMELPQVFRTTLETIPADVPYLATRQSRRRTHGQLHVGLVWAAGDWDRARNLSEDALREIAGVKGVRWHPLQNGPARSQWPFPLAATTRDAGGVEELAAVMAALDLVISVDSMPAHLAGALGRPTWTLLKADADWRWMERRTDSPWYPTMRLFRQLTAGDWGPVVTEVTAALKNLVRARETRDEISASIPQPQQASGSPTCRSG